MQNVNLTSRLFRIYDRSLYRPHGADNTPIIGAVENSKELEENFEGTL